MRTLSSHKAPRKVVALGTTQLTDDVVLIVAVIMEAVVGQLINPLDREKLRTELPFDNLMKTVLGWLTLAFSALLIGSEYFGKYMVI